MLDLERQRILELQSLATLETALLQMSLNESYARAERQVPSVQLNFVLMLTTTGWTTGLA